MFKEPCYREPFNIINSKHSNGEFIYNGIDRVDNLMGYTLNNVVACCKNCNTMKKDLNKEEFLNIITLIYNNFNIERI